MLIRRGYVPKLSFAAFDNGKIVAFTLNGIGMFNGIRTAYDTGTETVKEYRNSIESIARGASQLTCIGAFDLDELVGFSVFDRNTGDLTQIAVKQEYRRQGVASQLLCEVIRQMCTDFVKVINVPSDNLSLPAFLKSKNIPLMNKQFEMVKDLTRT